MEGSLDSTLDSFDFDLNSSWDVYFSRNDIEDWDSRLTYVTSFKTIKEFWAVYNHLKLPCHLRQGWDYMIFRTGIAPNWECDANKQGGRCMLEIPKSQRNSDLNNKWLETLLALIGEQLSENPDDVTGAVVQSRKKQDRISIWTRKDDGSAKRVARIYQDAVYAGQGSIKFRSHASVRSASQSSQSCNSQKAIVKDCRKNQSMDHRRMSRTQGTAFIVGK